MTPTVLLLGARRADPFIHHGLAPAFPSHFKEVMSMVSTGVAVSALLLAAFVTIGGGLYELMSLRFNEDD